MKQISYRRFSSAVPGEQSRMRDLNGEGEEKTEELLHCFKFRILFLVILSIMGSHRRYLFPVIWLLSSNRVADTSVARCWANHGGALINLSPSLYLPPLVTEWVNDSTTINLLSTRYIRRFLGRRRRRTQD